MATLARVTTPRRGGRGHPSRWLALGVLTLALLLVAVDATVLGLAIPFLTEDLRPTSTQLLWIGDVYSFVIAGLLVSMGSLGDRVGRKRLLLTGTAAFGALSVFAAYATTPGTLITARALMGVAGATLMPSTLALIRTLFPDARERSFAIGVWGAVSTAGAALGPVVGGLLLEHFWWGSVFLINLPVTAVLLVVGVRLLPESRDFGCGPWDPASVLLSLIGMFGVVYAVKQLAVHGPGPAALGTGLLGAACLYGFVRRQLALPAPLLDMRLFRHRGFSGAVLADLLTVLGLAGTVFFLSQFLQEVQGRSPLQAGLCELPATLGAAATGLVAGAAARRWSVRGAVAGGLGATGLALVALLALRPDSGYLFLGSALLVVGAGAGLSYTVTADVILSSVPPAQAGAASGVSGTAYELGAALGVALLGSIVTGISGGPASAAPAAFTDGLGAASAVGGGVLLLAAAAAWRLLRGQRLAGCARR